MVVLDDLQRADPESLALLVHVARFARRRLLVMLHRGVELDGARPTVGALAEIGRVREVSRGNPFFLHELGAQLQGSEDGPGAPGWRPPPEVRRMVGVWLSGLATDTRTLLAVTGEDQEPPRSIRSVIDCGLWQRRPPGGMSAMSTQS